MLSWSWEINKTVIVASRWFLCYLTCIDDARWNTNQVNERNLSNSLCTDTRSQTVLRNLIGRNSHYYLDRYTRAFHYYMAWASWIQLPSSCPLPLTLSGPLCYCCLNIDAECINVEALGGMEIQFHSFLTSALHGSEQSISCLWYPLNMRSGGPQNGTGHNGEKNKKFLLLPGIKPCFLAQTTLSMI